ncbi:EAL domain-containing protein [Hyphomicrobium sp.]|uniref:EAL domain-containing protein n=1 Tax=Hyphomicrobium sp. TaxID=82 RepID=UPI0025C4B974|nr:EAL domain-containing protein [Hyphomicrobium sp.]MCC7251767.1 EAL domain-containing protein [Hyphomicrobium sp.]
MPAFVNPFVSGRHRRLTQLAIWLIVTLALLTAGHWFWNDQLRESLRSEARAKLAHFDTLQINVTTAIAELQRTATAAPCSDQFIRELRRVAFKPDGLNEFLYAPGGVVTCSTSIAAAQPPIPLGAPDIAADRNGGIAYWINKRLDAIGLAGVTASVAFQEPFAVVVPSHSGSADRLSWVRAEFVIAPPESSVWPLSGDAGVFVAATSGDANAAPLSMLHAVACGDSHAYCVAVEADVAEIARKWRTELLLAIGLIGFYAIWPASFIYRALERCWSLEQRFRRNLTRESVICAYQPILDLRTGEISGCEVLARWRDVDGSEVPPDKFVEIVASSGQTLAFTRMVAERAFGELSQCLPQNTRLQINFNIFPRDLDSEKLSEVFRVFEDVRDRFPLALEIVESDALAVESAESEIEALARLGIRTYIDDFGSGYSSIHRVASLAIHGVKLDRSFAMAPSESLMARMLVHALEMIGSSGREIVVEGVETRDRLDLLIKTQRVAYAQGYLISRPLSIERLVAFLASHDAASMLTSEARAAA